MFVGLFGLLLVLRRLRALYLFFWGSGPCGAPVLLRRLRALYLFFWGSGPCGAPLLLRRLRVLYLFFWGSGPCGAPLLLRRLRPCVVLWGRSFFPELQPPLYGPTGDEEEGPQDEDGFCRFRVHGGGGVFLQWDAWTHVGRPSHLIAVLVVSRTCCGLDQRGFRAFLRRNSLMQTQSPGWMLWHSWSLGGDWTAFTCLWID
ncbi:uncharacterized protein LOC122968370 [Thunnus albacares]|uniref:uncharacterized protein LOC122968370 n=1 Tax=Thunnus albacares TaxID=8236 RepID=UPI001CF6B382|nr:uncharacterized protein LOC122968370 [Thunnus albacares]